MCFLFFAFSYCWFFFFFFFNVNTLFACWRIQVVFFFFFGLYWTGIWTGQTGRQQQWAWDHCSSVANWHPAFSPFWFRRQTCAILISKVSRAWKDSWSLPPSTILLPGAARIGAASAQCFVLAIPRRKKKKTSTLVLFFSQEIAGGMKKKSEFVLLHTTVLEKKKRERERDAPAQKQKQTNKNPNQNKLKKKQTLACI